MFKVNNKDTRISLNLNIFLFFYNFCCQLWTGKANIGREQIKARAKDTTRTSASRWCLCDLLWASFHVALFCPVGIYLLKVSNESRIMKICPKLTIKAEKLREWRHSGVNVKHCYVVSIFDFEQVRVAALIHCFPWTYFVFFGIEIVNF